MTVLTQVLLVGAAGFAGAVSRWALQLLVARHLGTGFPYGTLVVNVAGSLALGLLVGYLAGRGHPNDHALRLAVGVGFLGAFTTFSTFAYETDALLAQGAWWRAGGNVLLSVALGLVAVRLGIVVARV